MILSNLKFLTATIIFTVLLMAGYYTTLERKTFVCLLTHRGGSFPQDVADAIKLLVKQTLCSNSIKSLGFLAGPLVKSRSLPQNVSFFRYSSKKNYQLNALSCSSRCFGTQGGPGLPGNKPDGQKPNYYIGKVKLLVNNGVVFAKDFLSGFLFLWIFLSMQNQKFPELDNNDFKGRSALKAIPKRRVDQKK